MPTYERKCDTCGHEWEQEETVDGKTGSGDPADICPECGNTGHRLVSLSAFVLRGSGWGRDGYSG
jgi:putative FmdB family regulatory protein